MFFYLSLCTNRCKPSLPPTSDSSRAQFVSQAVNPRRVASLRFSGLDSDVERRVAADDLLGILRCLNLRRVKATFTLTPAVPSVRGPWIWYWRAPLLIPPCCRAAEWRYLVWWKVSLSRPSTTCRETTDVENTREAAAERCRRAPSRA